MSEQGKQWEVKYTTQNTGDGCKTTVEFGGQKREITDENCEEVQEEVQNYLDNPGGSSQPTNQPRKRFLGIF